MLYSVHDIYELLSLILFTTRCLVMSITATLATCDFEFLLSFGS